MGTPPGAQQAPPPSPSAPPQQGQQPNIGAIVHLLQALGGQAQGAMGTGVQAAQGLASQGQQKGQDVIQALMKLLGGVKNPMDSGIGNAILGGAPQALSGQPAPNQPGMQK